MSEPPTFFVPRIDAARDGITDEEQYKVLSTLAGAAPCSESERIYSIQWAPSRNELITATVGRHVVSEKTNPRSGKVTSTTDGAMVMAIYPGDPYKVVTNHLLAGRPVGSEWVNPIWASANPTKVTLFSVPPEASSEDSQPG